MNLLHTIFFFLVALGILIAFHEYGHYLAARLCGVKVLRYCLGFGTPFFSRRFGPDQTEWGIAPFPIGGYVKLLGQDPDDPVPAVDAHRAFNNQAVWKRAIIILAGPLANFILAISFYWGLNLHGVEEPVARVAAPAAGSPAARAGLQPGDEITRFDGDAVVSWNDLNWRLLNAASERRSVTLETRNASSERAARTLDFTSLDHLDPDKDLIGRLGFRLYRPQPRLGRIAPGSPADVSGLKTGDILVNVGEKAVGSADDFIGQVRSHRDQPLRVGVLRGGQRLDFSVTPREVENEGKKYVGINAGIEPGMAAMTTVSYGPLKSLSQAVTQTWDMSIFSLKMLGKMITGEVSWRNLSGPVTIADYAGKTARLGATYYLNFLALVSISLGVINLLPIPMLDGGHLMYYLAEIIRGKPVSERVMEIGFKFGLTIVAISMVLALYNDINRLLAG
ncbi:MAG TPA: RIP metalloprotease RseP [Burkholderiales bacterium]|jgi:regulator of sigma E protease|nr:RIP metalloprotease RseP [Burkholderiales bacterium]